MSDINTLVALVTPLFVQLLLYGVLLPIFFVAMRLLLARKLTLRTRKTKCFFAAVATVMFLISTLNIAVDLWANFFFFFYAGSVQPHTSLQVRLIPRDSVMMHI
jgi:hypothetical protein